MILSSDQMLTLWRRARGLDPLRTDCTVERFEGRDETILLATEMRQWYLNLLDTAPERMLIAKDMASAAKIESAGKGVWRVRLPVTVRRVLAVTFPDALGPVPVIPFGGEHAQRVLRMASGRYGRGCPSVPVVLGARNSLMFFTGLNAEKPAPLSIMCIDDPGDEYYELDESALSTIPTLNNT